MDYIEGWYKGAPNWTRLKLSDTSAFAALIEAANNTDVFLSVQMYKTKEKPKGGEESFLAPLYFDFDSANLEESRLDAVKVVNFLIDELQVPKESIEVYFSGGKGFHIIVNHKVAGITPMHDLHLLLKHAVGYISQYLGTVTLDLSIYTVRRMFRVPLSLHSTSKLYKIELTIEELMNLNSEDIKVLAKQPRKIEVNRLLKEAPMLKAFIADKLTEYKELQSAKTTEQSTLRFTKGDLPECAKDILNGGWKQDGHRNQAVVQLACFFKEAGYTLTEAIGELGNFTRKFTSAKGYEVEKKVANTTSVVKTIYSTNDYSFSCASIRALHGLKTGEDYERVACAGINCNCMLISEEKPIDLPLGKTDDSQYNGKLIRTKIMVAGKKQTSFIVPSTIEYTCYGKENCKQTGCPIYSIKGDTIEKKLDSKSVELIQMCGVSNTVLDQVVNTISGVKNCRKFSSLVTASTNVSEVIAIPFVENSEEEDNKYVVRQMYTVGTTDLEDNRYYSIDGYVFPHPRTQEGTLICKTAVPMQDKIESFKMSAEMAKKFELFKTDNNDIRQIAEKVTEICKDLTHNVTGIMEREDTLLGILLVMHSVLRLKAPWDSDLLRGWLELVVIGDTATGKSHLINKLMNFTGLGAKINAESTTRTGLTYKMEQSNAGTWYIIWGAWPRADKEFIWIDECSGIPKEEYGQMTLARSEGKLEVKRAVTAETYCRVRAVLTGNVPNGKRLTDYQQGCTSLSDIFNNEDIRRFDFATFMRTSDVATDKYISTAKVEHKFTADLIKDGILYAWSRSHHNVRITPAVFNAITDTALSLSRKFGSAVLVPLVSPADQKNKVLRLSVALASLLKSMDSEYNIVVTAAHVQFIEMYLSSLYSSNSCGLDNFAAMCDSELAAQEVNVESFLEQLKTDSPALKESRLMKKFIRICSIQQVLKRTDFEDLLNLSRDDARGILSCLATNNMLVSVRSGYRKTSAFNNFLNKMAKNL